MCHRRPAAPSSRQDAPTISATIITASDRMTMRVGARRRADLRQESASLVRSGPATWTWASARPVEVSGRKRCPGLFVSRSPNFARRGCV